MLDKYQQEIEGDEDKVKRIRKKRIKKLRKAEQRKWTMKYLINSVVKGLKNPLKIIKIMSESGDKTQILYKRK